MLDNKIKYVLVLFIILSLSMNAFGAADFTNDSGDVAVQSSVPVDKLSDDNQAGDGQNGDDQAGDGQADDGQADDNQNGEENNADDSSKEGTGNSEKPTFNFNGTGTGSFGRGNGTTFGGGNGSSFNISDILSIFTKLMGGNDNATNATNTTAPANETSPEVADVPKVATSTSYKAVSQPAETHHSQHTVKRVRDNKLVGSGDTLKLDGINKLFDSDFRNGHLLVYIDGKLVFNEITSDDLSTPIFGITDSYLGQHQISVEFTANDDSNGNTNKYTEDVMIA